MERFHTTRRKTLDAICLLTSSFSERADRKEEAYSSEIGGRSRGVLIVGGELLRVFEKAAVLCRKGISCKTLMKRNAATQVTYRASGYGDLVSEEKMLTPRVSATGRSRVTCATLARPLVAALQDLKN